MTKVNGGLGLAPLLVDGAARSVAQV
jgi:hypothetical protein